MEAPPTWNSWKNGTQDISEMWDEIPQSFFWISKVQVIFELKVYIFKWKNARPPALITSGEFVDAQSVVA